MKQRKSGFDPHKKDLELQRESSAWDTSLIEPALPGDIPIVDLEDYFKSQDDEALEHIASQLREACIDVGFCSIVGHQFPEHSLQQAFVATRQFHALATDIKNQLLMDQPDWPVTGVGYLPVKNRKLPARKNPNLNESFIIKRNDNTTLDDNLWPGEDQLPGFRQNIENYVVQIERLAKSLLPVYARALHLQKDYFSAAFTSPMYRLRLSHYPLIAEKEKNEYGIAPHVDTTFFTLLAQNSPGLVIYSEKRQCWIHAPVIDNAFIVNTGELLKQWSNDLFISVKHFANNNTGDQARYSIPFFFNANADYKMECLPTCCDADNPAKYPPISYLESQAVVQGE